MSQITQSQTRNKLEAQPCSKTKHPRKSINYGSMLSSFLCCFNTDGFILNSQDLGGAEVRSTYSFKQPRGLIAQLDIFVLLNCRPFSMLCVLAGVPEGMHNLYPCSLGFPGAYSNACFYSVMPKQITHLNVVPRAPTT